MNVVLWVLYSWFLHHIFNLLCNIKRTNCAQWFNSVLRSLGNQLNMCGMVWTSGVDTLCSQITCKQSAWYIYCTGPNRQVVQCEAMQLCAHLHCTSPLYINLFNCLSLQEPLKSDRIKKGQTDLCLLGKLWHIFSINSIMQKFLKI